MDQGQAGMGRLGWVFPQVPRLRVGLGCAEQWTPSGQDASMWQAEKMVIRGHDGLGRGWGGDRLPSSTASHQLLPAGAV